MSYRYCLQIGSNDILSRPATQRLISNFLIAIVIALACIRDYIDYIDLGLLKAMMTHKTFLKVEFYIGDYLLMPHPPRSLSVSKQVI